MVLRWHVTASNVLFPCSQDLLSQGLVALEGLCQQDAESMCIGSQLVTSWGLAGLDPNACLTLKSPVSTFVCAVFNLYASTVRSVPRWDQQQQGDMSQETALYRLENL